MRFRCHPRQHDTEWAVRNGGRSAANKAVVGLVGDPVFNRHGFSLLERHMRAVDIQRRPAVAQGRTGFVDFFTAAFEAVPDWSCHLQHIAAEGDSVWVHGRHGGTHQRDRLGMPATGRRFATDAVDIFRLENGMVAEHRDMLDLHGLFRQLGVIDPHYADHVRLEKPMQTDKIALRQLNDPNTPGHQRRSRPATGRSQSTPAHLFLTLGR